ncbi:MAG: hypothetical protein HYZ53_05215 [Planctomycetes bacterium]|nr:hypothetical protein [Planctomycetota bacterium]
MRFSRTILALALWAAVFGGTASAQEPNPSPDDTAAMRRELEELKKLLKAQERLFLEKLQALQARLDEVEKARGTTPPAGPAKGEGAAPPAQLAEGAKPGLSPEQKKKLEEEFAKELSKGEKPAGDQPKPGEGATTRTAPLASAGPLKLIDVSFDLLFTGGASTAPEADSRLLQGGDHDPKNRGFTVGNAELTLAGVVDPFFRGDTNIVFKIDDEGETTIELEEAYLTTLSLPANLQAKAGQFYTGFGRLNPQHPHSWSFIDHPVVMSRFFGPDGLRAPGAQLSWLTPLPFYAELLGSIQNAQGGTAFSFRNAPGEEIAGRTLVDRPVRSPADLLYLARLKTSFDPTDELTLVPGLSALFGPNGTGQDTRTEIYGVDFYAKWKPLANDNGFPFLSWQTEALWRRYEAERILVGLADGAAADDTLAVGGQDLDDWGFYSQVVWGFARPWTAGLRYDYAAGEHNEFDLLDTLGVDRRYDSAGDAFRDHRERVSANVTWYPSEFSKLRLQYNWDHASFLPEDDAHSVWLQAEIMFGAHAAHKF